MISQCGVVFHSPFFGTTVAQLWYLDGIDLIFMPWICIEFEADFTLLFVVIHRAAGHSLKEEMLCLPTFPIFSRSRVLKDPNQTNLRKITSYINLAPCHMILSILIL